MDLSILILNYQSKGLLKQCLRGIASAAISLSHEIIVIDNDSHDGSAAMVAQEFPSVQLIASPVNGGYAAGNNLGLLAAQGSSVLLLNPDIAVYPGAIEKMVAFLDSHPDAAVVGPKLVNPDGSVQMSCYRFPDPLIPILRRTPLGRFGFARDRLRRYLMLDWDHRETRLVDWVLGACFLVRLSAIEHIGLLDERFFLYFEDVDWCRRFWEAGYTIYYYPEAQLTHYHQRLSAENPGLKGIFSATTRIHIFSGFQYFRKYGFDNHTLSHETLEKTHAPSA